MTRGGRLDRIPVGVQALIHDAADTVVGAAVALDRLSGMRARRESHDKAECAGDQYVCGRRCRRSEAWAATAAAPCAEYERFERPPPAPRRRRRETGGELDEVPLEAPGRRRDLSRAGGSALPAHYPAAIRAALLTTPSRAPRGGLRPRCPGAVGRGRGRPAATRLHARRGPGSRARRGIGSVWRRSPRRPPCRRRTV
jgi:hypothetical protein